MPFLLVLLLALQVPPPAEKCSIEGRVVKAGSGDPLNKATLNLFRQDGRDRFPRSAATDENGRFAFRDLDPGRYQLGVERNGYVRQQYGQRGENRSGAPLTLERGQQIKDVVFRLQPHGVIAGRVTDEDGEAVPNVFVQVMRLGYREGRRQLMPAAGRATTNDLGEYRLFGLAPGRYYLSATPMQSGFMGAPGLTMSLGGGAGPPAELAYAPIYFPGVSDAAQATPVETRAGGEMLGVDFRLSKVSTVRIRGRVIATVPERPGRGTSVGLNSRGMFMSGRSFTQVESDGTFELRGVTPGSYYLTAFRNDGGENYSVTQPLEVGSANIEGVELVLGAGVEIRGRVRLEGKADVSLADLNISLTPGESRPMMGPSGAGGRVAADGTFTLKNVSPGTYRVGVFGNLEDLFVKSVRMGDAEVLDAGLTIAPGQGAAELDVTVSAAAGRVDGSLTDDQGQPLGGVQVWLLPDARRRTQHQLYKMAATDQNGRFVLRGLRPGEYKLFAWEDLEPGAHQDPEFVKVYEDKGKSVTVREGSSESVTLKLIPLSAAGGAGR